MTTDLVEKCASDLCVAIWGMDYRPRPGMMPDARWSTALHATLAVIDALADGVSDEMVRAGDEAFTGLLVPVDSELKAFLAAAIRAAKSREE